MACRGDGDLPRRSRRKLLEKVQTIDNDSTRLVRCIKC